jgi:carbon-monoxide dehydrogenase large subunit
VIPGYESANVRMLPDGGVLIYVGVQNHGQGHETSLAQIAAHELGIDPGRISVRYGDTAIGPYGFGTFASRSIVFAGGAVGKAARVLAEKIRRIGAHLLQADVADTRIEGGMVCGPSAKISVAEVAFAANARQDHLPAGMDPLLETVATYEPTDSGGVFAYGTHAVVVAVDPDNGVVELLDYVVSEDCGTMINPMIVDGQVHGGVAQGAGQALLERCAYDAAGQLLSGSFMDYTLPRADDLPFLVTECDETQPCTHNPLGAKGCGEAGAIAAPAAIVSAALDALHDLGIRDLDMPLTPEQVWRRIRDANPISPA